MNSHSGNTVVKVLLSVALAVFICAGAKAQQHPLEISAHTITTIILPQQTIPSEETAAQELQHYLTKITGTTCNIIRENQTSELSGTVIYVGSTQFAKTNLPSKSTFEDEEWLIQTVQNALILTGGRPRGTLYATYHFLEDICGVHWWTPWEESVPQQKVLSIANLKEHGQPAFRYRDVYQLYAHDGGRFMARSRLNRQGDGSVKVAYGGSRDYGPPYHVHTFYQSIYIDPKKYFSEHPEWFMVKGNKKPEMINSQLAMSNPEMRKEFLKLLLQNIRSSRQKALAKQLPPPKVYDVSQNDNALSFVNGPADKALVKKNGGAESAILLSFINYLADGVRKEFPDVYIETIAYHVSEQAPTNMYARDNVIIRLTDTLSNVLLPVTAPRNHAMRKNIEDWAKHSQNLRIWDYNITYRFPHLPQPTMRTYQPDLQFYHQNNVKGVFAEFERRPIDSDMRDMKLWVLCKLFENPNQDYSALIKEFTDGYYGAAGPYIRQYLSALQKAATKSKADIQWFSGLDTFTYLNTDFLQRANNIYTKAAAAVTENAVLSQRVATARSSVDIAILQRFRALMKEWVRAGNNPKTFPLSRSAAKDRFTQSMTHFIHQRVRPSRQKANLHKLQKRVTSLTSMPAYIPPPKKFRDMPASQYFTYNAFDTFNYHDIAKVVVDKQAESGYATRLIIPDEKLAKYKLPMEWGIFDTVEEKTTITGTIKAVQGPGYHWYKMGDASLTGHDLMYLFWSWYIQNDLVSAYDHKMPNTKYEVWASLKFEGPAFPYGKASDKNAISVERIVLVKK